MTRPSWATIVVLITLSLTFVGTQRFGEARTQAKKGHLYRITIGAFTPSPILIVNKYAPQHLTIHVGDSVQWTNLNGKEPQTVTFGPAENVPSLVLDPAAGEVNPLVVNGRGGRSIVDVQNNVYSSGALMSGIKGLPLSYTFTFPVAGTFVYRSLFHPAMQGDITVVPVGHPASPDPTDRGDSMLGAMSSLSQVLPFSVVGDQQVTSASPTVYIGYGNDDITVNEFAPSGLNVPLGTKITWVINETNGDLHAIVFGQPSPAETSGSEPLYTGRGHDGGLTINPTYLQTNLLSGTKVTTATVDFVNSAHNGTWTSGLMYGSSAAYSSPISTTYTLTFQVAGTFHYVDPFHSDMNGVVNVIAPPL